MSSYNQITLSKFSFDLQGNSFRRMYERHFALRWDAEWPLWAAWRITLKTAMMMLTSTLWMSVMGWWLTKPSNLLCFRGESGQCVGELREEHVGATGWLRTSRFSGRRWFGTSATELGEGLHREGRTLFHRSQLRYRQINQIYHLQIIMLSTLSIFSKVIINIRVFCFPFLVLKIDQQQI